MLSEETAVDDDEADFLRELKAVGSGDEHDIDEAFASLHAGIGSQNLHDEYDAQPDSLVQYLKALENRGEYFSDLAKDIHETNVSSAKAFQTLVGPTTPQAAEVTEKNHTDLPAVSVEAADAHVASTSTAELQPHIAETHIPSLPDPHDNNTDIEASNKAPPATVSSTAGSRSTSDPHPIVETPAEIELPSQPPGMQIFDALAEELAHEKAAALQLEKAMQQDRHVLQEMLLVQAAKDEVLEARNTRVMDELQESRVQDTLRRVAGMRIARYWRQYLRSPKRVSLLAAALCMQAGWRAKQARTVYLHLHAWHEALSSLTAAIASGNLPAAEAACQRASALGDKVQAQGQLDKFRKVCTATQKKLQVAAAQGTHGEMQAAVKEAQKLVHLQQLLASCQQEFAGRQQAAVAALQKAVQEEPMTHVLAAVDAGSKLGVPPPDLTTALESARARDKRVGQELHSAASAFPYSDAGYQQAVVVARGLKLTAELAVAEGLLDRRRARVAAGLSHRVAAAATAAEAEGIITEAKKLGVGAAVEVANGIFRGRQAEAMEKLLHAAASGSSEDYQIVLDQARMVVTDESALENAERQWRSRQAEAGQQLLEVACTGQMRQYQLARAAAYAVDNQGSLVAADIQMIHSRYRCVVTLQQACRALATVLLADTGSDSSSTGELVQAKLLLPGKEWLRDLQLRLGQQPNLLSIDLPANKSMQGALAACKAVLTALDQCGSAALLVTAEGALLSLELCASWKLGAGSSCIAELSAARSYWGALQLPEWGSSALSLHPYPLLASLTQSCKRQIADCQQVSQHRPEDWWTCLPPSFTETMQVLSQLPPSPPSRLPVSQKPQTCMQWPSSTAKQQPGTKPLMHKMLLSSCGSTPLTQLVHLDLSLEGLTSINIVAEMCPLLQVLLVNQNKLTAFPKLQGLTQLTRLSIKDNQLSSLDPPAPSPAIQVLHADGNSIGTLCNLHAFPSLRELSLADNHLSSLGACLHPCPHLLHLQLAGNRLQSLDSSLAHCSLLHTLDVSRNHLTSLETLTSCPLLTILDASNNRLTALPPALPFPHLITLRLSCNSVTALPPALSLPSLHTLLLRENRLTSLAPLLHLPSLHTLDLAFNSLSHPTTIHSLSTLPSLRILHLNDNPLSASPDPTGPISNPVSAPSDPLASTAYPVSALVLLPQLTALDHQLMPPQHRAAAILQHLRTHPGAALHIRHLHMQLHSTFNCIPFQSFSRNDASPGTSQAAGIMVETADVAAAAGVPAAPPPAAPAAPPPAAPAAAAAAAPPPPPAAPAAAASAAAAADAEGVAGQAPSAEDHELHTRAGQQSPHTGPECSTDHQTSLAELGVADISPTPSLASSLWQLLPRRTPSTVPSHHGSLQPGWRPDSEAGCSEIAEPTDWLDHLEAAWPTDSFLQAASHTQWRLLTQRHHLHASTHSHSLGGRVGVAGQAAGMRSPATASRDCPWPVDVETFNAWSAWGCTGQEGSMAAGMSVFPTTAGSGSAAGAAKVVEGQLACAVLGDMVQENHQHMLDGLQGGASVGVLVENRVYQERWAQRVYAAVVTMQAAWRGMRARRVRGLLQVQWERGRWDAAAVRIQAAYRGHRWRGSRQLAEAREARVQLLALEAQRSRQESEAAMLVRKEAAAMRIQAFARGLRVRRRLRAALEAARYVDGDDASDGTDSLPAFDDTFLADLEAGGFHLPPNQPSPMHEPSPAEPAPQLSLPPIQGARVPGSQPATVIKPTALALDKGALRSTRNSGNGGSEQAEDSDGGQSDGGSDGQEGQEGQQEEDEDEAGSQWTDGPVSPGAGSQASSIAGSKKRRSERYQQKLQALMKDWGFKDMATAEAYLKRQNRQLEPARKKQAEAVTRSPDYRLQKLKQQVDAQPKLRPQDARRPKAGPHDPLPLHSNTLRGPPSRGSAKKPPSHPPSHRISSSSVRGNISPLPSSATATATSDSHTSTSPSRHSYSTVPSAPHPSHTTLQKSVSADVKDFSSGGTLFAPSGYADSGLASLRRLTDSSTTGHEEDQLSVHSFNSESSSASRMRQFRSSHSDKRRTVTMVNGAGGVTTVRSEQPADGGREGLLPLLGQLYSGLPAHGSEQLSTQDGTTSKEMFVRSWAQTQQAKQQQQQQQQDMSAAQLLPGVRGAQRPPREMPGSIVGIRPPGPSREQLHHMQMLPTASSLGRRQ